MYITREEFEAFVPSAVMPDDTLFDRISDYMEQGVDVVQSILGESFDYPEEMTGEVALLRLCNRLACLEAYHRAIPHLDLVLTENGFGVVSNQNVAPASADRVRRLQQRVQDSRDDAIDDLIDCLRDNDSWNSTTVALGFFGSLVWNAHRQLPLLGVMDGHRTKLMELRPKINGAEEILKQKMSAPLFYELCSAIRLHEETDTQKTAIHQARLFISAHIAGDGRLARLHLAKLVEFLESHLDSLATYAASTAHEANSFTNYENQKDDPCYFFG